MASYYYFGLDGGGTHSRLAVCSESGLVVKTVTGGSTNIYGTRKEDVYQNLKNIFEQISAFKPLRGGCIGSAGLGRRLEQGIFREMLDTIIPQVPVYLCGDGEIFLVGALSDFEGYGLISGTGSLALSRTAGGMVKRAGGYGYLLGDEGSAYWIAHQALVRSIRSLEKRDLVTDMLPSLIQACSLSEPEELINFVQNKATKADIARLAPLVSQFALQKDPLAMDILTDAAKELVLLVESVQNPMISNNQLVVAGGVLDHDQIVRPLFNDLLHQRLPDLRLIPSKGSALDGACLLGRSQVPS